MTIRILIVDDKPMPRRIIRAALAPDPAFTVVGEAGSGQEAVAKVSALHPDLVTLAMELPDMNGLDAIERIMARHPVPILVVDAKVGVRAAFSAISKGALDVLELPAQAAEPWPALPKKIRLLANVDIAAHLATMKIRSQPTAAPAPPAPAPPPPKHRHSGSGLGLLAIASSTGGPQALQAILCQLPPSFPWPIVIAQHMTTGFSKGMTDWLDGSVPLKVREAEHGDNLQAGTVYINPPEVSMRITDQAVVHLEQPDPKLIYHPSCDFMLTSVAAAYGDRVVAAILTGMGSDGVAGMRAIKAGGGLTLAEDEASSVVFGMNRLAVESRCIDQVMPLQALAAELLRLSAPAPW
jgi:two-component system chemotaxis response regulator CheB